jgi:hypothetical protein
MAAPVKPTQNDPFETNARGARKKSYYTELDEKTAQTYKKIAEAKRNERKSKIWNSFVKPLSQIPSQHLQVDAAQVNLKSNSFQSKSEAVWDSVKNVENQGLNEQDLDALEQLVINSINYKP